MNSSYVRLEGEDGLVFQAKGRTQVSALVREGQHPKAQNEGHTRRHERVPASMWPARYTEKRLTGPVLL